MLVSMRLRSSTEANLDYDERWGEEGVGGGIICSLGS